MFSFMSENKYVEHEVQKAFTPKVSGTFEHASQMSYLINHARMKQRSSMITLLDLKNAFGEVHHSLITEVLNYHHMPEEIEKLISSLYTGFPHFSHHKVVCNSIYSGGPGRFARRSSQSITIQSYIRHLH